MQAIVMNWEPVDDAYISYRFAKNWAEGNGCVYNVGERVEGYTNFLWVAILAGVSKAGFDIKMSSLILGSAFSCLSIVLTWVVARNVAIEQQLSLWHPWMAALLVACSPGWAYWTFSGMEGMLLVSSVLAFVLMALMRSSHWIMLVATGCAGLVAVLTRWEIILLWPIVIGYHVRTRRWQSNVSWVSAIWISAILFIGFAIYFALRWAYYGELLPNTFHAKAGGSIGARMPQGLLYTGELGVQWLLPITGIVWLIERHGTWTSIILFFLVIYGSYVTWTGGDAFPWLRFYLPIIPFCGILLATCIERDRKSVV